MNVKRDNGTEIDVEWGVEEHGCQGNGWDDDGHGSIVYLTAAEDADGKDVLAELTDGERDRIETECAAAQDEDDANGYDDEPGLFD